MDLNSMKYKICLRKDCRISLINGRPNKDGELHEDVYMVEDARELTTKY